MADEYAQRCDEFFAWLEELLDEHAGVADYESNGQICEITCTGGSQIVINRQPANQEIWLAAKSGGFHFRHDGTDWIDTRDGKPFGERLEECLQ
ncbi:MAG: iron donor protein CyaY [Betaproteobacteria bacterium]|nr:iron donor protein CyaY [Betaproteobacteria bacterium]